MNVLISRELLVVLRDMVDDAICDETSAESAKFYRQMLAKVDAILAESK